MPLCVKCNRDVCNPCVRGAAAVAAGSPRRRIVVARDIDLVRPSYFCRLAIATANLDLSRRKIPDWMADAIFGFEGQIVWPNGTPFVVSDTLIDDAFNNDGSFRWLSDFVQFAERSPGQAPQQRILTRLRLLDLSFKIEQPDIARHFGR